MPIPILIFCFDVCLLLAVADGRNADQISQFFEAVLF